MVAIPAQRDRVLDSVVGRVTVDVVDFERAVGAAAVGALTPVDGEHLRPQPRKLSAPGAAGSVLAAVAAIGERTAAQAGAKHQTRLLGRA